MLGLLGLPLDAQRSIYIFFVYFQLRDFPSAIHSIACARRFCRVASCLASVIHSTYSRWWLGGN